MVLYRIEQCIVKKKQGTNCYLSQTQPLMYMLKLTYLASGSHIVADQLLSMYVFQFCRLELSNPFPTSQVSCTHVRVFAWPSQSQVKLLFRFRFLSMGVMRKSESCTLLHRVVIISLKTKPSDTSQSKSLGALGSWHQLPTVTFFSVL